MATLMDNIPEELRRLDRWVCANADSKRPMRCDRAAAASVSKPDTWGTFEEAREAVEAGIYDYAGFVFDGDGFVGIDIDHAFGEDGMPTDEAMEAVLACASYTELSKSGRGFHIVCRGELPFRGRNNRSGWEIYRESRYFVLTGRTVVFGEIENAQDGIDAVLAAHFADVPSEGTDGHGERIWEPEWELDEESGRMRVAYSKVSSGSRHLAMVSYCGYVHNCMAHRDALLASALAQNEAYMVPPLPAEEVRQVVDSVTRYRR